LTLLFDFVIAFSLSCPGNVIFAGRNPSDVRR